MTGPARVDLDRGERHPLLRPSRWPVLAGFVAVAVGTFLPWQTMTYPVGAPLVKTGTSGFTAPGLAILAFAIPTALAACLRRVADSRTRIVQLLPAVLGCCVLALAAQAYLDVAPTNVWDPSRSLSDVVEPGMWIVLAGSLAMAIGGVLTTVAIARANPLRPEEWQPAIDLSFVRWTVATALGLVLAIAAVTAGGEAFSMAAPFVILGLWPLLALLVERLWRACAAGLGRAVAMGRGPGSRSADPNDRYRRDHA
jgi:hypothetical protein